MWSKKPGRDDKLLFPSVGIILGLGLVFLLLQALLPAWHYALDWRLGCPFQNLTGLYCPGCGGQRGLKYLLWGEFGQSLYHHPLVLPFAIYLVIYFISQAINRISRGKTPALCFRMWHLQGFLALLFLQWIVKNILLLAGLYSI